MTSRPFQQLDVFTATPYLGNPLAVVLDAGSVTPDFSRACPVVIPTGPDTSFTSTPS
mgnify:CR=1 FL=1